MLSCFDLKNDILFSNFNFFIHVLPTYLSDAQVHYFFCDFFVEYFLFNSGSKIFSFLCRMVSKCKYKKKLLINSDESERSESDENDGSFKGFSESSNESLIKSSVSKKNNILGNIISDSESANFSGYFTTEKKCYV